MGNIYTPLFEPRTKMVPNIRFKIKVRKLIFHSIQQLETFHLGLEFMNTVANTRGNSKLKWQIVRHTLLANVIKIDF